MTAQGISQTLRSFIAADELENALNLIAGSADDMPEGVEPLRWKFVVDQASTLRGQLKNLQKINLGGTADMPQLNIERNKVRERLFELVKIIEDPTFDTDTIKKAELLRKTKKIGAWVLGIYGVIFLIILSFVLYFGRMVWTSMFPTPLLFEPAPDCTMVLTGHTTLYKDPAMDSPQVGSVQLDFEKKEVKVVQVAKIKRMGNEEYYFKITVDGKTGWVYPNMFSEASSPCFSK